MAFNGSGVFVRLYNWVNDAASNIKIRADRMDNEMNGMATGLTTCITKDGQTTITADLPMATFKHTGVGDGTSRTHYTSVGQTQDGKINWVAAGGTADVITAAYAIPVTAVVDGEIFYVRAGAANATTTPTFSPNGLTAHTIVKSGGSALAAGDIVAAGHELVLRYNLANTRYELLNPGVVASSADMILSAVQTVTGAKTFGSSGAVGKLKIAGTTSGATILDATAIAGSGTVTLPTTGTLAITTQATDTFGALTDITTNNASTSAHGFAPKYPNDATKYLDGTGAYTVPSGIAAGLTSLASGSFPAAATLDISSISQAYRGLLLTWTGVSSNTATRKLTVDINLGGGFGAVSSNGYIKITGTTVSGITATEGLTTAFTVETAATAAQTTSGSLLIDAYQTNSQKEFVWRSVSGDGTINYKKGTIIGTGALSAIEFAWDNSGNFDAGTYVLYGIA